MTIHAHSMMPWQKWVVLIAGSDRLGINADRSSEPNIALDMPAQPRSPRKGGGFFFA
jgi:hypothetical protein